MEKHQNYIRVGKFEEIDFEFGLVDDKWLIFEKNTTKIKNREDENFIEFFRIMELPPERIYNEVNRINYVRFIDMFPIVNITKTAYQMNSSYWLLKCIYFLLKYEICDLELLSLISEKNSWYTLPLKQKIKQYKNTCEDLRKKQL